MQSAAQLPLGEGTSLDRGLRRPSLIPDCHCLRKPHEVVNRDTLGTLARHTIQPHHTAVNIHLGAYGINTGWDPEGALISHLATVAAARVRELGEHDERQGTERLRGRIWRRWVGSRGEEGLEGHQGVSQDWVFLTRS